jgi:uncharacterized protein
MSGPAEAAPAEEAETEDTGEPEAVDDEAEYQPPDTPARDLAVVLVFDVAVNLPTPHALVTLRELDAPNRRLAIPVGLPEATALAHAWRGVATPRPLTHELFADVLVRLGATIDAVRFTGRRAGVVLAEMELTSPRGHELISCRPTDALTLAIRQAVPAPMLVDVRLFDAEGDVEPA